MSARHTRLASRCILGIGPFTKLGASRWWLVGTRSRATRHGDRLWKDVRQLRESTSYARLLCFGRSPPILGLILVEEVRKNMESLSQLGYLNLITPSSTW
ncbi:hypothetical protein VE01_10735 [Pseudogymnoascus verrucosus]|uniref:Uncharacterized protein n=1 Tax=Pseudogymnoascus verrucosus TaxID=342668 RepID=A0A2P6FGR8_9PEZI|nr:uncharacterized protein VE01_10735 [Pseudogymnoascus verrucosus]PQM43839.1 hypothetical protein VE01_10735 [Pseudogymnoascus verrucosus]